MKVYLSWSGELGRRASSLLRAALQQLLPKIEVWSPGSDISAGARWADQTQKAIQASDLAIVCITNDSRNSSWLLYEVGVMIGSAKTVIPWLVDIEFSDLEGPLSQFQAIRSNSQSFRQLVELLQRKQPANQLAIDTIERWANDIEKEIVQLIGRRKTSHTMNGREEWLAQIEEASSTRNRELLQNLVARVETENVSDKTVLLAILNAYFDFRDLEGLIDTFQRLQEKIGQDSGALSKYSWALIRTAQSDQAIQILKKAQAAGNADAEVFGLLGRAYKDQWREQLTHKKPVIAEECLQLAAATYTKGFHKYPNDFYLGLNAVQLLHLLGDSESLLLRDQLIPAVQAAANEFSDKSSGDFWATSGLLELAVIQGSQAKAQQLSNKLITESKEPWELAATVQNLRVISEAKGFGETSPNWLNDLIKSLSEEER